jgi:hypothetical protein
MKPVDDERKIFPTRGAARADARMPNGVKLLKADTLATGWRFNQTPEPRAVNGDKLIK